MKTPEYPRTEQQGEQVEKTAFMRSCKDLGITPDGLQGRAILDIGAGSRIFAGYCLRHNIAQEVYSLEPNLKEKSEPSHRTAKILWTPEIKKHVDAHTLRGVREAIPVTDNSVDLILAHGALPGVEERDARLMRTAIDRAFEEILRILKPGGEARLYPLFENDDDRPWPKQWSIAIKEKLATLESRCTVVLEKVETVHLKTYTHPTHLYRIIIKKMAPETVV